MPKELSQPETRLYRTFRDPHDRIWGSAVDKRTGHSVGPWEPQFEAPWYPEAKYIKHNPSDDRLILIDYDRNISDLKEAQDAYDDLRLKVAMNQYGSAFPSKLGKTHEEDPPELKALVGQPPFPSAFPEAAKEGNKWVLGLTNVVPAWAYVYLHAQEAPKRKYLDADEEVEKAVDLDEQFDPDAKGGKREPVGRGQSAYTAFVSEMSKQGKNLREIAQSWRERKEAVNA